MPTDPPSELLWGSFRDLLRQKCRMGHGTNAADPDQIVCICDIFIPVEGGGAYFDVLKVKTVKFFCECDLNLYNYEANVHLNRMLTRWWTPVDDELLAENTYKLVKFNCPQILFGSRGVGSHKSFKENQIQ